MLIHDHDIEIPVVIEITKGTPAAHVESVDCRAGLVFYP